MSSRNFHLPMEKGVRKYYFAYHSVNGLVFQFAWVEDDGLCVGGRPQLLDGKRWEITEEEFGWDLNILARLYPLPRPSLPSPSVDQKPI